MKLKMKLAVTVGAAGLSCLAATESTLIKGSGDVGTTSFNDGSYWSGGVAPMAEGAENYTFVIKNKLTSRTPTGAKVNKVLGTMILGEKDGDKTAGYLQECEQYSAHTNDFVELIFRNGSYTYANSRYSVCYLAGKITVDTAAREGCQIGAGLTSGANRGDLHILAKMESTPGSGGMKVGKAGSTGAMVVFEGDCSGYTANTYLNASSWTYFANITFNGEVIPWGDSNFGAYRPSDNPKLNKLTVGSACNLLVPVDSNDKANGIVSIKEAFSHSGAITVVLSALPTCHEVDQEGRIHVPLIRLESTATGSFDTSKVVYGGVSGDHGAMLENVTFDVDDGADGSRTLRLNADRLPYVWQTVSDVGGNAQDGDGYTSAVTNPAAWSDKALPHEGAEYLVDPSFGASALRLPASLEYGVKNKYTFAGDAIVIGSGATLYQVPNFLYVNKLQMQPGSNFLLNDAWNRGNEDGLYGEFNTVSLSADDSLTFKVYFYQHYTFFGPLTGNGNIVFTGHKDSANSHGFVGLPTANPDFHGTMYVTIGTNKSREVPSDLHCETLTIACGGALGGALDAFNYKALRLDQYSVLEATNDVSLTEMTRGVFVQGLARFRVSEGATLSVAETLTLDGELRKEGAGELVLGGAQKFLGSDGTPVDDPTAGKNVLTVNEGAVSVSAPNAVDGLSVSFASGDACVALHLDASAEVRTFGFRNVKNKTNPFVAALGGGIPVRVVGTPVRRQAYNLAVATVDSSIVNTVKDSFALPVLRGYTAAYDVKDNEDGTSTIVCALMPKGLLLVVE